MLHTSYCMSVVLRPYMGVMLFGSSFHCEDVLSENNTSAGKRGFVAHFPMYLCSKVISSAQSSGCRAWTPMHVEPMTWNWCMSCSRRIIRSLEWETACPRLRVLEHGISSTCCRNLFHGWNLCCSCPLPVCSLKCTCLRRPLMHTCKKIIAGSRPLWISFCILALCGSPLSSFSLCSYNQPFYKIDILVRNNDSLAKNSEFSHNAIYLVGNAFPTPHCCMISSPLGCTRQDAPFPTQEFWNV